MMDRRGTLCPFLQGLAAVKPSRLMEKEGLLSELSWEVVERECGGSPAPSADPDSKTVDRLNQCAPHLRRVSAARLYESLLLHSW